MSVSIAHNVDSAPRTQDVLSEKCSFEELGLNIDLLKTLHDCGFQTPSPIQYRAIPIGLCGFDLVVQAKSGTGKTLVFGIICLETVEAEISDLQALILSPTREIAVQTEQLLKQIGRSAKNLKAEVFIGGLPIENDRQKLLGCQIAVGAPGRIKHLLVKRVLNPNKIRLLILDEADHLITPNFLQDVKYIYSCLPNKKQIIAASATYSSEFSKFMKVFMKYPSIITPKYEIPTLLGIKQFVSIINNEDGEDCVVDTLTKLFSQIVFKQCIVFTNIKSNAAVLTAALKKRNWPSEYLTSDIDQVTRLEIINKLWSFKCRVLVTTDLTARGIDAENVNLVINVDVPLSHATYLHRIGRAGRYGSYGIAVTLINGCKELTRFKSILHKIGGDRLSVNILPQDKLPDLWDFKAKHAFERLFACPTSEISEHSFSDSDSQIDCFIRDISDVDFGSTEDSLNIELTSNNLHDKNKELKSNELSENISTRTPSNGALQLECFDNLGDDFEAFMKSDSVSHDFTEQKNLNHSTKSANDEILFDKCEISEKLFNRSMKSDFPMEDLNSLMLNFDKCDITAKLINDPELDENVEDVDCISSAVIEKEVGTMCDLSKSDEIPTDNKFMTKIQVVETNDLNNESKNGVEEKAVVKPNIADNKQLDDEEFLQEKTEKTSKPASDNSLLKTKNLTKNLTDEEFVTKLRAATADLNDKFIEGNDEDDILAENVLRKHKNEDKPIPIIKPKPVNKKQLDEDRAFLEMIKAKTEKEKVSKMLVKDTVPDSNKQIVNELKDAMRNIEFDIFYSKDCEIITSPEIIKTKHNGAKTNLRSMDGKEVQGDAALIEMVKTKEKTKKSANFELKMDKDIAVPCKSSNHDKDSTDGEFVTKLRAATSDWNEKFIEETNEQNIQAKNILRKYNNEEKPTPIIKPKPINKKQLDEDRAFLELIKTKAVKEKVSKVLAKDRKPNDNEQIVKDLNSAMLDVDIDTFSSKEGKVVTSPEIIGPKNVENTINTPKNITKGRSVLKAFRKCKSSLSDAVSTKLGTKVLQHPEDVCDVEENDIVEVELFQDLRIAESDTINPSVCDVNSKSHSNIVSENFENIHIIESETADKNALSNNSSPQEIKCERILDSTLEESLRILSVKLEKVDQSLTKITETDNKSELLNICSTKSIRDESLPSRVEQTMTNIDETLVKINDTLKIMVAKLSIETQNDCIASSSGFVSKIDSKKIERSDTQEGVLDNSGNDKTLDDCNSTLQSVSDKENTSILKTSKRNKSTKYSSGFRRNVNNIHSHEELKNTSQSLGYNLDPMYAYKIWNENWMQQVWQINNCVAQSNYCRDFYTSYYK